MKKLITSVVLALFACVAFSCPEVSATPDSTASENIIATVNKSTSDDDEEECEEEEEPPVKEGPCASILTEFCSEDGTVDIGGLINLIISIVAGFVAIAGTIGIIICGILWMTARDNEVQVIKAKKRISEIVVGVALWILLSLLANLFIPKSPAAIEKDRNGEIDLTDLKTNRKTTKPIVTPKKACKKKTKTKDNSSSTNTSTKPIEPLNQDSSNIACAKGTTDLGTTSEAYYNGNKITIRLCSIPTITSTSSEDTDGHIHVNSRVSGAYYALGKKYQETYGSTLGATQSFRSMSMQQYFYNCYISKSCNNGNLAAKPGYSNHQLGTAVDFIMNGSGWGDTGVSGFFNQNLSSYGLNRGVSSEDWHVSPSN